MADALTLHRQSTYDMLRQDQTAALISEIYVLIGRRGNARDSKV
jgi:hypothetical protein